MCRAREEQKEAHKECNARKRDASRGRLGFFRVYLGMDASVRNGKDPRWEFLCAVYRNGRVRVRNNVYFVRI